MLHPDKSKLPPDYFLFYKKAFDIVCQFYENQNKQNADISSKNTAYVPIKAPTSAVQQVSTVIEKMGEKGFQDKFNELFEKNMAKKQQNNKLKYNLITVCGSCHSAHNSKYVIVHSINIT